MAGLKYWVWLSEVKGLTNRSKLLLLDYFGTPENVYYADEDEYRLVEGIEPRQIALLAEKSLENADRILGACSRLGLRLLTMQDADYPMRLRNIFEPPCLLYVKGQLPVIDEEVAVAMVGTRKASPYGIEAAEKIAYGLCKQGAVVISGAAAGVDSASHRGALRAGGKTIAVLGNGLDVVYPAENAWLYRDIAVQPRILRRIDDVEPVAEHGDGLSARAQRAAVRCAVHARRRAGDHDRALLAQAVGDLLRRFNAVGRGLARADHGDSDLLVDNGELAFDIKQARRLKDIAQAHRIVRVLHREKPQPQPRTRAEDTVGVFQRFFREQCDLPRLDALDEAVLVLVGIVDVLRRAEIVEQQKL